MDARGAIRGYRRPTFGAKERRAATTAGHSGKRGRNEWRPECLSAIPSAGRQLPLSAARLPEPLAGAKRAGGHGPFVFNPLSRLFPDACRRGPDGGGTGYTDPC